MNIRLYNRLVILLLFMVSSNIGWASPSLPSQAMGKPKIFTQSNQSYKWKSVAKNHSWGELSANLWTVYALEEGTKAYEDPNGGKVVSVLHFMEDLYVAQVQNGYMLLYVNDSPDREHPLEIPKKIRNKQSQIDKNTGLRNNGCVGWVAIDELLLWSECPRTPDGVYEKISVVKDVDLLSKTNFDKTPLLYKDENCTQYCGSVSAFDFYFAYYKASNGNMLVCTDAEVKGSFAKSKVGWIEKNEFIPWNTRVCWEPAFGSSGVNDKAYAFESDRYAESFNLDQICSSVPITTARKRPSFPRCPILEFDRKSGVAKLAVIGSVNNNTGGQDPEITRKQLEALENSISQINIVFVMDATNSMRSCFDAMSKAVKDIVEYKGYDNNNVKFGVVAYRNYKDESVGKLVRMLPLTSNANDVITFLDKTGCSSIEKIDQKEAMFYGLNYAADSMKWTKNGSNYIILVSDVSTNDPDKKGYTSAMVVNKLHSNNINLVAFQARSYPEACYRNYSSQVGDIIDGLLKAYGYNNVEPKMTTYQTTMYQTEGYFPYRPMGYKWKDSNDQNINSSELTGMVEGTIKLFIAKTEEAIRALKNSGDEGPEINPSICKYLIKLGIIKRCEDLKSPIKISGYSSLCYDNKDDRTMFVPCVFMAEKELSDLIQDLSSVTKGSSSNRRGDLQKQCLRLILSYTGQSIDKHALSNPEMIDAMISSIEKECGYQFDRDVKQHVKNPNRLSDEDLDILVNQLGKAISGLQQVQSSRNNYIEQNGCKYYYILLKDMPLVKSN